MSETSLPPEVHKGNGRLSPETAPVDPFDPARLRMSQNFAEKVGVKKALLTVPVRKPSKEDWVRVHPDDAFRIQTGVLELKNEREIFLVDPSLWDALATEPTFGTRLLFLAVTRQDVAFLWPVKLPTSDGRRDTWGESQLQAANMAQTSWVRVVANMSLGAYDVTTATSEISEPNFPDVPFSEILRIAFGSYFIRELDHPVIKNLRGQF